ncbi:major histocompatibility complex class I-related gene protein-like [Garra rufa]|uniref:major histocompatibility complex class I-related gene protein-like n=1 Tax=Garra rufa TaxID=137080 RepID=UPI003CCE7901
MTTYVGINGQSSGIPEFSAVTTLDGQQIDYYDSEIKKLIPRQDWMKEFASGDTWKEDTEIREVVQQIYKYNILRLIERFNQTRDVYTYQRIYGCEWDDQTEDSHGFDQYGYDGEDLISLDLKELVYITAVPQGLITTTKWNNDRAQLVHLKEYYRHECVFWLKEFLKLREGNLKKIAPQVSLLQKDSSSPVVCHATGFYPPAVTITWLRNGEEHYEDVDLGETLPNEDGTFQKTSTLNVHPDDWKKNKYAIVVEHIERTFNTILPGDEIGTNTVVGGHSLDRNSGENTHQLNSWMLQTAIHAVGRCSTSRLYIALSDRIDMHGQQDDRAENRYEAQDTTRLDWNGLSKDV